MSLRFCLHTHQSEKQNQKMVLTQIQFFFIFIFWLCPGHIEVPGLGTEWEPQLWPSPQLQQCQILKPRFHKKLPLRFNSFFFFVVFSGPHLRHMEVPRLKGSNQRCSCRPAPQPQQGVTRATSVTYTTAHSNTVSLTHWVGPGIEPESSWILVRFLSTEPWRNSGSDFILIQANRMWKNLLFHWIQP